MRRTLITSVSLAALLSAVALGAQGAPPPNPGCEGGVYAVVKGPCQCNNTGVDQPFVLDHTQSGPVYESKDDGSDLIPTVKARESTEESGPVTPTVTVPAGTCIQIFYGMYCCPSTIQGKKNCSSTDSIDISTVADCDNDPD